jgi:hypothetical protein
VRGWKGGLCKLVSGLPTCESEHVQPGPIQQCIRGSPGRGVGGAEGGGVLGSRNGALQAAMSSARCPSGLQTLEDCSMGQL